MILGIDTAATKLHTVTIDATGTPVAWTALNPVRDKALKDGHPDVRRTILYRAAVEIFATTKAKWVFCEEPLALQNGKTTRLLGLAAGAVWAAHLETDIFWGWAGVTEWKKRVVGKGNASKDEVTEWSKANGGGDDWDEDNHDAYAIARFGASVVAAIENDSTTS